MSGSSGRGGARFFKGVALASASWLAVGAGQAMAQEQAPTEVGEIIVTAQKREEAINTVPMSITAVTGDSLTELGVTQTADLSKVVPGFTYTESKVGTPIYTLRGVGFADIALGGRPTVSVYHDEAPVPFTIETRGGNLDLSRVEVLMGPQGTLFGQNSTGGAINLVANRPTSEFQSGLDLTVGNFAAVTIGGFLSGPITPTLKGRIAVQQQQNEGWQKNYRTGDRMAALNLTSWRMLLDWTPSDRLSVGFNLNGFLDRSESQAPQFRSVHSTASPFAPLIDGLLDYPAAPNDNAAADWTPDDYARDNRFIQGNIRVDYDLTDALTLTSLSSYGAYDEDQVQDIDGMSLVNLQQQTYGSIESFFQELRVAGDLTDQIYFVLGANYASDRTREENFDYIGESTQAYLFTPLGLPLFTDFRLQNNQDIETTAVFGNVEFQATEALKLYAGARYTHSINEFEGCTSDSGDGNTAVIFTGFNNFLRFLEGLPPIPAIAAGGCVTSDQFHVPHLIKSKLDEDNVSWRVGADWDLRPGTMVYANVSRGYKAGGFPTLGATATAQYDPTLQESVTAYEVGIKSRVVDTLQLNAAVYHYDYEDKQVLGIVADPIFDRLLRLINIPESEINGAEVSLNWAPVEGLNVRAATSYVDSEILGDFVAYNPLGVLQNFGGEPFPNTPEWQHQVDVSYQWPVNAHWDAFAGLSANYQDETNTELGQMPELAKKSYTLVDLRGGVESDSGAWRLMGWVRNAADETYWTSAARNIDVYNRFMGMPRTFGVTLTYRYN